jgi:hypothetical protein
MGEGANGSVVIITVFEGTLAAIRIAVVVSAVTGAMGAAEAIEVGDAVEAGDLARAVGLIEYMEAGEVGCAVVALVVISAAVGVRNRNIAMASAAEIFEVIHSLSLP